MDGKLATWWLPGNRGKRWHDRKKADTPDLAQAFELTAGAIERLICPDCKQQVFMRDSKAPGLRVRVTAAGAKSFVFEAKLNRLPVLLDGGTDPRELERQQKADKQAKVAAVAAHAVTVGWE